MKEFATKAIQSIINKISTWSWKTIYQCSDAFSYILNHIIGYRKKVIFQNIQNSFPTFSELETRQVADQFYKNMSDIIFESIKLAQISKEEVLERIQINTSLFDNYYAKNQNLVVVLGHLGNWELANLFASVRFSHQVVVVYHQLKNKTLDDWIYQVRTRFGSELVPMREAILNATVKREKPFLFFLVNDQSPNPSKAFWTKFLYQDTGVFRGVETIARAINAPVIYAAVMRQANKRGYYEIQAEEITENPNSLPQNAIIEKQIKLLERDITLQPENWLWSHRRWKHKKPAQLMPEQKLVKKHFE